ncbi:MAG: sigma-54-dependent Fis family transcriptional regulator [Desulfobacterales bacterium]|nr:sigma-54-dependent Fis family transcriptional regulator [Desulfobacterales bacterium]
MAKILIIDDDEMVCEALTALIMGLGHNTDYTITLHDGLDKLHAESYDIVFLDVNLPDGDGLESLPQIQETPSRPEVIIITGMGDADGAELAIKSGAWDYITKPPTEKRIALLLIRVLQFRKEKRINSSRKKIKKDGIIGGSPIITRCLDAMVHAAGGEANVLITGETGTGKELFARAIHNNSARGIKEFVTIDCAALPPTLVESTLFGHKKGAFTGANTSQIGLIKQANAGSLFLDEVGELSLETQKVFLRVIQERRFRPVGERKEIKSDFRLIAATNRNFEEMVKEKKFREDLLFRLRGITIDLPPLRDRADDITELTVYYLSKLCKRYGFKQKEVSADFLDVVAAYSWPGNVRELINAIERSIAAAGDAPTLFPMHLPSRVRIQKALSSLDGREDEVDVILEKEGMPTFMYVMQKTEERYVRAIYKHTKGNISRMMKISGLSRTNLYNRLSRLGLSQKKKNSGRGS